jgi:mRNA interferase MazF
VRRGEVWWADYPPQQRHRVLLLSWDAHGNWRNQITVALITSKERGLDAEVHLGIADKMSKDCVVNLDTLATIKRALLDTRICELKPHRMAEVEVAIHRALGMDVPCNVSEE